MTIAGNGIRPRADKDDPAAVALISSAFLNAAGVVLSLREIGWQGRIICLNVNGSPNITERWPNLCETWRLSLSTQDELFDVVTTRVPAEHVRAFLFTDERFMPLFASGRAQEVLPNIRFHVGSAPHLETILDRRLLYRFLTERRLADVPRSVPSSADPWREFGPACWLRLWRSWDGLRNLGHGEVLREPADLERWQQRRIDPSLWGFQELLSTRPEDNLSVCGWHEPDCCWYRTVQRLFPYRQKAGPVFEAVEDPAGLETRTHAILTALDYIGPFEMEFIRDTRQNVYKVNELNPRFWAQHRLLARCSDNWLVRRYLGEQPRPAGDVQQSRYWVNPEEFLPLVFAGRWRQTVPYLRSACWSHPLRGSWGPALRRAWHELW